MSAGPIVVDAANHLLGRLASVVAKQLLNGKEVVCVRCECINVTGSLFRNQVRWNRYLRKRTHTNPKHGPFHHRAPSMMLKKAVRGMLPRKTHRGEEALSKLKVFDGIPHPYDLKKRVVVPDASRVVRLNPVHKYCVLGDLASSVGWKHKDLLKRLEDKRKARSKAYHERKIAQLKKTKAT